MKTGWGFTSPKKINNLSIKTFFDKTKQILTMMGLRKLTFWLVEMLHDLVTKALKSCKLFTEKKIYNFCLFVMVVETDVSKRVQNITVSLKIPLKN